MRNRKKDNWKRFERILSSILGSDNVSLDADGITLNFDLKNKRHAEINSHLLLRLSQVEGAVYFTRYEDSEDKKTLLIPESMKIPLVISNQSNLRDIDWVLSELENHMIKEGQLSLTSTTGLSLLENATGVSWKKRMENPYDTVVIEPSLSSSPDSKTREEIEVIAAKAMGIDRPESTVHDWVAHQSAIEEEKGERPRVALPTTIADPDSPRNFSHLANIIGAPDHDDLMAAFAPFSK